MTVRLNKIMSLSVLTFVCILISKGSFAGEFSPANCESFVGRIFSEGEYLVMAFNQETSSALLSSVEQEVVTASEYKFIATNLPKLPKIRKNKKRFNALWDEIESNKASLISRLELLDKFSSIKAIPKAEYDNKGKEIINLQKDKKLELCIVGEESIQDRPYIGAALSMCVTVGFSTTAPSVVFSENQTPYDMIRSVNQRFGCQIEDSQNGYHDKRYVVQPKVEDAGVESVDASVSSALNP